MINYYYDNQGNVIKKEYYDTQEDPFQTEEMKYDNKNRLIEFTRRTNAGSFNKEENKYNSNDLIIEKIYYQDETISGKITYEYIY